MPLAGLECRLHSQGEFCHDTVDFPTSHIATVSLRSDSLSPAPADRSAVGGLANVLAFACGMALIVWALWSNAGWFDRHVLPNYCPRSASTLAYETIARWTAAALGAFVVLVVRPKLVRMFRRPRGRGFWRMAGHIAIAVMLALVSCDLFLRWKESKLRLEDEPGLPPMRIDETGNYVPIPSRAKQSEMAGREIRYEIDADGNRAATMTRTADPEAPTVLFTGESIAMGYGVAYEHSYPYLVGRAMGIQSVNVSVTGFSSDQAYLRLRDALPKFERPLAVVTLVLPEQIERNVNDRRQRLALDQMGRLELLPMSNSPLRTSPLWKLVPYHSDQAIALTRAILRATDGLARARGARSLFVLTNFGPPCLAEFGGVSRLEHTLFSGLDVAHLRVDIPEPFMIKPPNEVHPNEKGHESIAAAIVRALRSDVVVRPR